MSVCRMTKIYIVRIHMKDSIKRLCYNHLDTAFWRFTGYKDAGYDVDLYVIHNGRKAVLIL